MRTQKTCPRLLDYHLPQWVPQTVWTYLSHTVSGKSIREIARRQKCHPSTILRQIRKHENQRDDLLADCALDTLSDFYDTHNARNHNHKDNAHMTTLHAVPSDEKVEKEARRILRRLCENNTFLLISPNVDKAAVFKTTQQGKLCRLALVDYSIVHAFSLKEWIKGENLSRVGKYHITPTGRKALKRLLALDHAKRGPQDNTFAQQHQETGNRVVSMDGKVQKIRVNLAESPLTLLARKKDKFGNEYLSADLLEAGERFREDFERAQMGARVTQNWDRFLTGAGRNGFNNAAEYSNPSKERFATAYRSLAPGLRDVALRVCCYLEGLEKTEKQLGWSARSGKVVLKIALQSLANHYGITGDEEPLAS